MILLSACQAVVKADIRVKVVIIINFVIQTRRILRARQIAVGQLIRPIRHIHRQSVLVTVLLVITTTANRADSV